MWILQVFVFEILFKVFDPMPGINLTQPHSTECYLLCYEIGTLKSCQVQTRKSTDFKFYMYSSFGVIELVPKYKKMLSRSFWDLTHGLHDADGDGDDAEGDDADADEDDRRHTHGNSLL